MGLILVFGTTSLWHMALGIAAVRVILFGGWTYKISWPVLALASIIGVTAIYSPNHFWPVYAAGSILICHLIVQNAPRLSEVKLWLAIACILTLIQGSLDYLSGASRVSPLHANASLMGMMGMSAPLTLWGMLFTGFSLSRTAIAGYWLYAVLLNRKAGYGLAVAASILFVALTMAVSPARITLAGVAQSTDLRVDTITGDSVEMVPDGRGGLKDSSRDSIRVKLLGYGYAGYTASTGRLQPHTPYILTIYELGVFAGAFWGLLIMIWRESRNWYLLGLAPISLLVDDFYRIEGIYMVTMLHLFTRGLPSPLDNWRRFVKV
jgi:hypothetical protein